jgi:hypothetical protein
LEQGNLSGVVAGENADLSHQIAESHGKKTGATILKKKVKLRNHTIAFVSFQQAATERPGCK